MVGRILPIPKAIDNCEGLPASRKAAKLVGSTRYFTGIPCPHGHVTPRKTSNKACLGCHRIARVAAHKAAPQKRKRYPHPPDRLTRSRNSNPLVLLFAWARYRAKKREIEFSLSPDDIIVPECCPCCGVKLAFMSRDARRFQPSDAMSLDRIDNSKGYIPGNAAILCWGCNDRKGTSSLEQLRALVKWI